MPPLSCWLRAGTVARTRVPCPHGRVGGAPAEVPHRHEEADEEEEDEQEHVRGEAADGGGDRGVPAGLGRLAASFMVFQIQSASCGHGQRSPVFRPWRVLRFRRVLVGGCACAELMETSPLRSPPRAKVDPSLTFGKFSMI